MNFIALLAVSIASVSATCVNIQSPCATGVHQCVSDAACQVVRSSPDACPVAVCDVSNPVCNNVMNPCDATRCAEGFTCLTVRDTESGCPKASCQSPATTVCNNFVDPCTVAVCSAGTKCVTQDGALAGDCPVAVCV